MVIKKITSIILAASTFATFALAGATVEASTEDPTIKHVGKTTQQDGILTAYNYNVSSNSKASVKVYKSDKDYTTIKFADFFNHPQTFNLGKKEFKTETWLKLGAGGIGGSAPYIDLSNSAGKYECVKIKLSDFSSYFNTNGTHTEKISDYGNHKYTFKEEAADANSNRFSSALLIYSGGAINHVVPDKDGMVQIYISTKPGVPVKYTTSFCYELHQDGSVRYGGGGGSSGSYIGGLTIGDCDQSGYMDISDATAVQRYSAKMEDFNKAQIRCGDLNGDGVVNIMDATLIQKAIANLD